MEESKEKAKKSSVSVIESDETDVRLDRWIRRRYPSVTQGQIQKWLRTGQIRVDGKRVDSAFRLSAGQAIRLPPPLLNDPTFAAKRSGAQPRPVRHPEKLRQWVLYEDEDVVAINKPAGLAVQGGTGLKENLDDSLMVFSLDGETRPKLVHRLDRETSGVLLIARNDFAAAKLAASFRAHTTQKIYWALTCGAPPLDEGEIDVPLIKSGQLMRAAVRGDDKAKIKTAVTRYKVVERMQKKAAFVVLWPLTGRTHQLRVHLAHLGTPIWGDPLYGEGQVACGLSAEELGSGLHLHARRLMIPHPRGGKRLDITAPLGQEMQKTWRWFHFDDKADTVFEED